MIKNIGSVADGEKVSSSLQQESKDWLDAHNKWQMGFTFANALRKGNEGEQIHDKW